MLPGLLHYRGNEAALEGDVVLLVSVTAAYSQLEHAHNITWTIPSSGLYIHGFIVLDEREKMSVYM